VTAASAIVVAGAAGCGLGPGRGTSDVSLTVTRGFGSVQLHNFTERSVPGSETVMRLLERRTHLSTRYGGGFVQSIDGLSGGSGSDWFYYVNGIEAAQGAATTTVHRGDRVWWDRHDWSQTETVPAVVGSYPEPFVHGVAGKRLPTVLQCAPKDSDACSTVAAQLHRIGVPAPSQLLGTGSGTDSLGVLVGTWSELRALVVGELIARGPRSSGVYARFGPGALQLLDPTGRVVRTLGAGAGLIAATRDAVSEPVWVITGTDRAGVAAAAAALTVRRLRNHFALAVRGSTTTPVPVVGGR
jgi:Domain of unknown function (DUF4430)